MTNKIVEVTHLGDRFDVGGRTYTGVAAICCAFRRAGTFEFLVDASAAARVAYDLLRAGLFVGTPQPAALPASQPAASAGPEQLVVLVAVRPEQIAEVGK